MRQAYMVLYDSTLIYGITYWGGINRTHIVTVHTTQKLNKKVVYSLPLRYPSAKLFKQTHTLSI